MDRGIFDLRGWVDPAILVLKAGDTATLRADVDWFGDNPSKVVERGGLRVMGWLAPTAATARFEATEHVEPDGVRFEGVNVTGWDLGLYNVGGPSRDRIERGVVKNAFPAKLQLRAANDWGPGDWVQIRLYDAWVDVAVSNGRYVATNVRRLLAQPRKSMWIMGA